MTLDLAEKTKLLREFHVLTVTKGWNFDRNGIDEKDRFLRDFDGILGSYVIFDLEYCCWNIKES